MCLRKSPVRTPAFLAAHRRNAQKCTGPRTPAGKARSSLNALKHGNYARRLPEKLLAVGANGAAALYASVRQEVSRTFGPEGRAEAAQAERTANAIFCVAWQAGVFGTKLECPLFSMRLGPRFYSLFRFRIDDPWNRVGLVYWVQRKGFWTLPKLLKSVFRGVIPAEAGIHSCLDSRPSADSGEALSGNDGGAETGAGVDPIQEPPLRQALENRLRHRVFRLRRPSLWDRVKYGLDDNGNPPRPRTELEKLEAILRAARARANPHEVSQEDSGDWEAAGSSIHDCRFSISDL